MMLNKKQVIFRMRAARKKARRKICEQLAKFPDYSRGVSHTFFCLPDRLKKAAEVKLFTLVPGLTKTRRELMRQSPMRHSEQAGLHKFFYITNDCTTASPFPILHEQPGERIIVSK